MNPVFEIYLEKDNVVVVSAIIIMSDKKICRILYLRRILENMEYYLPRALITSVQRVSLNF